VLEPEASRLEVRTLGACGRRNAKRFSLPSLSFHSAVVTGTEQPLSVGRPTGLILIDFDNLYPEPPTDPSSLLRHDVLKATAELTRTIPSLEYISVRYYGGWLHGGVLSRDGSNVSAALRLVEPFPIPHPARASLLHGSVELATRLLALPDILLPDTVRSHEGLRHIRVAGAPVPPGCVSHPTSCPAVLLRRFSRARNSHCPVVDCPVTNSSAFVRLEQKMVDSMLTCDAIYGSDAIEVAALAVLSTDVDLMPGMLMAAARRRIPVWVGPSSGWDTGELATLAAAGALPLDVSA